MYYGLIPSTLQLRHSVGNRPEKELRQVEKLQNMGMRMILGLKSGHVPRINAKKLSWIKFEDKIQVYILCLVHAFRYNSNVPSLF